jgi:hypothetical protein
MQRSGYQANPIQPHPIPSRRNYMALFESTEECERKINQNPRERDCPHVINPPNLWPARIARIPLENPRGVGGRSKLNLCWADRWGGLAWGFGEEGGDCPFGWRQWFFYLPVVSQRVRARDWEKIGMRMVGPEGSARGVRGAVIQGAVAVIPCGRLSGRRRPNFFLHFILFRSRDFLYLTYPPEVTSQRT